MNSLPISEQMTANTYKNIRSDEHNFYLHNLHTDLNIYLVKISQIDKISEQIFKSMQVFESREISL